MYPDEDYILGLMQERHDARFEDEDLEAWDPGGDEDYLRDIQEAEEF